VLQVSKNQCDHVNIVYVNEPFMKLLVNLLIEISRGKIIKIFASNSTSRQFTKKWKLS